MGLYLCACVCTLLAWLAAPNDATATGNRPGSDTIYTKAGDVASTSAVVWGRCTDEAVLSVLLTIDHHSLTHHPQWQPIWSTRATMDTDYTASITLRGLHPDTTYYYKVNCATIHRPAHLRPQSGSAQRVRSSNVGTFRTAPSEDQATTVRFVWAADLAGQGWGRNPELSIKTVDGSTVRGGYVIFEVMRRLLPNVAIFQGDMIYADNAIVPEAQILAEVGGGTWINEPTKDFVAQTLDQFRANWKYSLGDEHFQNFVLSTPIYAQWDDHEVSNNWYPSEILTASPYNGMSADLAAERAKQALFEFNPIGGRDIFRKFRYGKHAEIFLLDERTFRGPNPENSNPDGIEMLGQEQFSWLLRGLKDSTATWKIISTHDPLSIVTGGAGDYDAWAQGNPAVLGREVQLRKILSFIRQEGIKNVVYLTADVHFAAAISYEPARAVFKDFNPFYEFVIGPMHAGAFGPGELDASFGPAFEFLRSPGSEEPPLPVNLPPPNFQSFGLAEVDATGRLTVQLIDITGEVLYEKVLDPQ